MGGRSREAVRRDAMRARALVAQSKHKRDRVAVERTLGPSRADCCFTLAETGGIDPDRPHVRQGECRGDGNINICSAPSSEKQYCRYRQQQHPQERVEAGETAVQALV